MKIIVTGYIALKMNEEKFHQELQSGCWHPCKQSATPHQVLILHMFVTSLMLQNVEKVMADNFSMLLHALRFRQMRFKPNRLSVNTMLR
jgi:hypothetical protein